MALPDKEIDITRSIKTIEMLKSELLTELADLYKVLAGGARDELHEAVGDVLSNIILISYLLGKRPRRQLQCRRTEDPQKIRLGLVENNDVEKYGDCPSFQHLGSSRRKEK